MSGGQVVAGSNPAVPTIFLLRLLIQLEYLQWRPRIVCGGWLSIRAVKTPLIQWISVCRPRVAREPDHFFT